MASTSLAPFGAMRSDNVVPFAMKLIGMKTDPLHLVRGNFTPRAILAAIQTTGHFESFRRRCLGKEMDDGFVVP
jgi:hypothetical protein